jgi:hypothetical protein
MALVIELAERYKTRAVRCLGIDRRAGWRLKVYGITYRGERPDAGLVEAALAVGYERLPTPPTGPDCYGVGFLGVHQGRGENFVFVDWWAHENELHHHVWFSDQRLPTELRAWRPEDPIACAWDLGVIAFEQAAWVRNVLANPDGPDLAAYLAEQLDGDI